jgi:hypothetical protein
MPKRLRAEPKLAQQSGPSAPRTTPGEGNAPRPRYLSDRKPERPTYTLLRTARARAKRDCEPFTLTEDDIDIPDLCPATGISLYKKQGRGGGSHSPSLEIIDRERGWVPGNVVVISYLAKRLKSDATVGELLQIADFYEQLRAPPPEASTSPTSP